MNHKQRKTRPKSSLPSAQEEEEVAEIEVGNNNVDDDSDAIDLDSYRVSCALTQDQITRYSRQINLPGWGPEAQQKVCASKVAVVGAGGLGSSVLLYLAGAGVGHITIIDHDDIDMSNLHRQIIHADCDVSTNKAWSAQKSCRRLNPDIVVEAYTEQLSPGNAERLLLSHNLVVDCTDNPAARYLINDTALLLGIPLVSGSAIGFEGQLSVLCHKTKDGQKGPCYRCLFPKSPPIGSVVNCAEGGVLGVVPGIIGTLQALEALKLLGGVGEPAVGKLFLFDSLTLSMRAMNVGRRPDCVCNVKKTREKRREQERQHRDLTLRKRRRNYNLSPFSSSLSSSSSSSSSSSLSLSLSLSLPGNQDVDTEEEERTADEGGDVDGNGDGSGSGDEIKQEDNRLITPLNEANIINEAFQHHQHGQGERERERVRVDIKARARGGGIKGEGEEEQHSVEEAREERGGMKREGQTVKEEEEESKGIDIDSEDYVFVCPSERRAAFVAQCEDNPAISQISAGDYAKLLPQAVSHSNSNSNSASLTQGSRHVLLDVRVPIQFAIGSLKNAVNIPLAKLEKEFPGMIQRLLPQLLPRPSTSGTIKREENGANDGRPVPVIDIYCMCRRGVDSLRAVQLLNQHERDWIPGVRLRAHNIRGGTTEWHNKVDPKFPLY